MKTGLKRICSMILLTVLLLGMMPTAAPLEAFAYTEGDIPGTTGKGTEASPVVCNNFSELKAALELQTGSTRLYIKLTDLLGDSEVLPDVPRESAIDMEPAVISVGTKILTVEGDPTFIMDGLNHYDEVDYSSFIQVDGALHVNGTGTLTLDYRGNTVQMGRVFHVAKTSGWLQFSGDVTVRGTIRHQHNNDYVRCMAVLAEAGKLDIMGRTLNGDRIYPDNPPPASFGGDG